MTTTTLTRRDAAVHGGAAPQESVRRRAAVALRQHRVLFGGTAAVMLHIADDNFLQPNEGVSAGDHLVSGLVPLLALLAAAATYPRVRAGTRGLIALGIALAGLVVALEAGYYSFTVGPSGDDWTGWGAAVAGLVLLGLGTRLLWRSRRVDGGRTLRYGRRLLRGVVVVVFLSEVVGPFATMYLTTHVSRAEVPAPDLGADHEDVTLTTSDGLHLQGWYVPSRNGAAVIAFPGRQGPQAHTRMLVRHGYGVLLFDRRGEGVSDGDPNMWGWGGQRDIHAAVDFLRDRPDVDPDRIGGIGFSVGGEMMLQAAAENPGLAAVVSEGAGTRSIKEEMVEYDGRTLLRGFHALLAKQAGIALFADELPPPSLVDLVPRIAPRPTLLIWAPNGGNRETMNPVYQRLIGSSADIWSIRDARHIKGLQTHPEEYERRVVGFFDRALLDEDLSQGTAGG
jgi:hypothetical protein